MNRQRLGLAAAAAVTLSGTALAQSSQSQSPQPHELAPQRASSTIRYGGIYHAATGTWTRGDRLASAFGSAEVIYSNTAGSSYFAGAVGPIGPAAGGVMIDDGIIPSTTDPTPFSLGGPGRDTSDVSSVQFGYCDFDPNPGVAGFTVNFYSSYSPCTYPPDPAQLAGTVILAGAPSNGCWIIDVDISQSAFFLSHDGEGIHDGDPTLDSFGFEWSYTGTGTANAGLLISGDPQSTDAGWIVGSNPQAGSNTYYGSVSNCAGIGSGYENGDFGWIEDVAGTGGLPVGSNCYFFGGYNNVGNGCGGPIQTPYGAYHMELAATGGEPPCICIPGCTGNLNATGVPGQIDVTGDIVAANNNATIRAFDLPANQFGIFATGLQGLAPGTINSGNGTLCINPGVQGGLGRFAGQNQIKNSGPTGEFALDTNAGEWDLSMIPTSVGTYAAMAGVTSHFQAWHREPVGAGFNFTSSTLVSWQ